VQSEMYLINNIDFPVVTIFVSSEVVLCNVLG